MAEEWLTDDTELEPAEAVRLAHSRYEKTIEFERVPGLFNLIAEKLYAGGA
jgi:hypothetical protein